MKQDWLYRGKVIDVAAERVELPNGREARLEIIHHPGGAAVVAVDEAQRVCLLRQFRHAAGGWIWELPAGRLEPGEPPETTASRELLEEAGVSASEWRSLGDILSTPGVCDEVIYLFMAGGLTQGEACTEEHECLEVHWLPMREAIARCLDGGIRDAKTLAGLFRAWSHITHGNEGAGGA